MAEEPLPAGGSCLLGSINLSAFVKKPFTKSAYFDFKDFEETVEIATIGLNDVLDEGVDLHPLQEQRDSVRNWRQMGLGIMGLADTFIKMGYAYGDKNALSLLTAIGSCMINKSVETSSILAKMYGTYPKYNDKVLNSDFFAYNVNDDVKALVKKYGLRNSQLLTCAPTGSTATMIGTSNGIEPIFAKSWRRKTISLHNEDKYYIEYPNVIKDLMSVYGLKSEEELPKYVVTAQDINPRTRINTQATLQKFIDASISSTINLPFESTIDDVKDIYTYAWSSGLKGITIYRSGCKREGILTTDESTKNDNKNENNPKKLDSTKGINTLPRGYIIKVNDDLIGYKKKITNGCGKFHFSVFFDDVDGTPYETFIDMGDGGGCERNLTFISKLISKALRAGVPLEEIIETAKSIRPCKAYTDRTKKFGDTSKGTSCPSAIGWALEELNNKIQDRCFADFDVVEYTEEEIVCDSCESCSYVDDLKEEPTLNSSVLCPECSSPLVFEGGCNVCKNCGWSKCD